MLKYEFHLPVQVDEKLLMRAMRKSRLKNVGGFSHVGLFVLSMFRGGLFAIGGIALVMILLRMVNAPPYLLGYAGPVLGVLLSFATIHLADRFSFAYQVKRMLRSPIYSGETAFTLSASGLVMQATNVQWSVSWVAIDNIIDDRDALFFYAGAFTYVLPKSVLGGADVKDILADIENWRRKETVI
ncbi:MAG: hypothetical protein BM558_11270 [Roseobacter sp. MedPE-SW]|nr:MAG: hypothetical protein BM558_11270 [Roseobacter sp. MedPE-SW]